MCCLKQPRKKKNINRIATNCYQICAINIAASLFISSPKHTHISARILLLFFFWLLVFFLLQKSTIRMYTRMTDFGNVFDNFLRNDRGKKKLEKMNYVVSLIGFVHGLIILRWLINSPSSTTHQINVRKRIPLMLRYTDIWLFILQYSRNRNVFLRAFC